MLQYVYMSEPQPPENFSETHPVSKDPKAFVDALLSMYCVPGETEAITGAFAAVMERNDPGGKQAERDKQCEADLSRLGDVIDQDPSDPKLPETILAVLEEHNFVYNRTVESSPLFPEGRDGSLGVREVLRRNSGKFPKSFWEDTRSGNVPLSEKVLGFIETNEMLPREEYSEPSSREEFVPDFELYRRTYADLREEFGAKAAGLIVLDATLRGDTGLTRNVLYKNSMIEVPPFIPVSKRLYAFWQSNNDAFVEECENVREQACKLPYSDSPLLRTWMVAIRSSAVKSEDGDEHSAAGVYHSGAADVRNPDAFRSVIEQVFASTTSENALLYQQEASVENEEMGLVVQLYCEQFVTSHELYEGIGVKNGYYGHANYVLKNRAVNVQVMDAGSLLYDSNTAGNFRLKPWPDYADLHTDPDHGSFEYLALSRVRAIPYAVDLASYLFGKSMEVEFHNNKIVQVRPYIENGTEVEITFPDNKRALVSTRSVGVIDDVLPHLDGDVDNRGKTGYIIIKDEYCFTASGNYKGFPKEGVVILLKPSDGHVQAYCRERGLTCLFPKSYRNGDYILEAIQVHGDDGELRVKDSLRVISDGFEARVYDEQ